MSILKRSITPIFNFKFERDDDEFTCSGDYNGSNYNVSLRHHGPTSLAEINRMDNEESNWENFIRILDKETKILFESPQISIYKFGMTAFHFLVVDIQYDSPHIFDNFLMSSELLFVNQSILQSLHLNTSSGLSYERTYSFRFPLQNLTHFQSQYNHYHIRELLLEYGRPSILKNKKLIKCKDTFLAFLDRRKLPKSTLKTLLYMAYRYHQATFNMAEISHKFLILMVIFESLFKRKTDKNASQAAKRISKFISKVQSNQKHIQNFFFDNKPDCFCTIRNRIAHGDSSLDTRMVKSKYQFLYKFITKAMIKLVEIPPREIDLKKNYYDEIEKYIKSYFSALPPS